MAKAPKAKTKCAVSIHSRAARRAQPDATPKTSDPTSRADEQAQYSYSKSTTSDHYSGISKKKRAKAPTHQQRLRREKAIAKAEQAIDKLSTKVEGSKARAKRLKGRNGAWEDVNALQNSRKDNQAGAFANTDLPIDDDLSKVEGDTTATLHDLRRLDGVQRDVSLDSPIPAFPQIPATTAVAPSIEEDEIL